MRQVQIGKLSTRVVNYIIVWLTRVTNIPLSVSLPLFSYV